jgi:hypothetical protein
MIGRIPVLAAAVLGALGAARALEVTGVAPQVEIKASIPSQYRTAIENQMNTAMAASFNTSIAEANADLQQFNEQKELAQGFANANAYSMQSATLQGYQNYKLFAVGGGIMMGIQAPSTDFSYLAKVGDEITEKGDLYADLGLGGSLTFGLNAGFLVPGLYLNAKWGAFEQDLEDFKVEFNTWGVGANYRLFDSKSALGLVKWRGVSVGSGFYYQSSKIGVLIEPAPIVDTVPFREAVLASTDDPNEKAGLGQAMDQLGFTAAAPGAETALKPNFNMGLDITTMTVPLDVSTAFSFLWGLFNVSAGAGVDLNFGSSEIVLEAAGETETETDTTKVAFSNGEIKFDGSSDNSPSLVRPRLNAGLGLGLGPVKIDVPVAFYPASGFAAGVSVLVVW